MIDTSPLINNFVALLRDVPDLIVEMAGDPARMYAYHDEYPVPVSLAQATHDMPAPSIMAVWLGMAPGTLGGVEVWKHSVTLYLRAGESGGSSAPYYRMFRLITKGVPATAGVEMLNATVHPSCYPMDLPTIQRQTDAEGVDYFEMPITFTEIGDD